jgi:hypothetical protein
MAPDGTLTLALVERIEDAPIATLLADPRREVAKAALERAASTKTPNTCDAWSALLAPSRIDADPTLASRAAELARDTCLAPAIEGAIAHGRLGVAAVDSLVLLTEPDTRAQILVRLVKGADEATFKRWWGAEEAIDRVAWSFEKRPPPGLVASLTEVAQHATRPAVARVAMSALDALSERAKLPAGFFELVAGADCSARTEIVRHRVAFDAVLTSDDDQMIELVAPLLEDTSCAQASGQLAYLVGVYFAHRTESPARVFGRVRQAADKTPAIRDRLRDGLMCGGTSCDDVPTCHRGDRDRVVPERDRLLERVGAPMCP